MTILSDWLAYPLETSSELVWCILEFHPKSQWPTFCAWIEILPFLIPNTNGAVLYAQSEVSRELYPQLIAYYSFPFHTDRGKELENTDSMRQLAQDRAATCARPSCARVLIFLKSSTAQIIVLPLFWGNGCLLLAPTIRCAHNTILRCWAGSTNHNYKVVCMPFNCS